jgi:hypothetical protein
LRLTVDSSEPLEEALRVVGALYGVTLVVSENGSEAPTPIHQPTSPNRRTARKSRNGTVARAATKKPRTMTATRSTGMATNAEVRSWARDTGLAVHDRGRVPASVLTAYHSAHE